MMLYSQGNNDHARSWADLSDHIAIHAEQCTASRQEFSMFAGAARGCLPALAPAIALVAMAAFKRNQVAIFNVLPTVPVAMITARAGDPLTTLATFLDAQQYSLPMQPCRSYFQVFSDLNWGEGGGVTAVHIQYFSR